MQWSLSMVDICQKTYFRLTHFISTIWLIVLLLDVTWSRINVLGTQSCSILCNTCTQRKVVQKQLLTRSETHPAICGIYVKWSMLTVEYKIGSVCETPTGKYYTWLHSVSHKHYWSSHHSYPVVPTHRVSIETWFSWKWWLTLVACIDHSHDLTTNFSYNRKIIIHRRHPIDFRVRSHKFMSVTQNKTL